MYRVHLSSRAATHILAIMQERFIGPYHHWFEILSDIHGMWWGEFQVNESNIVEKICMGPDITHDQDEACTEGQEQMMKYWESPKYNAFCERNKRKKNEGRGGWGVRKHTCSSISFTEHQFKRQVDLTKRFSKSRHLEELHKH
ncbi:hypothetical protein M9H77_13158 [Catharanthus roseus]|uniref:Uncharacterized protein n=1 Tax=Catharanthus roseus TaxID=4058 RepID=A0ACC0BJJ1_CATRO|nr:hypothetical protein M9H77_13158 [Catharanthus roseus]